MPGRPSEISDVTLVHLRDTLLATFEYHWAEVGWELQGAKSLKSIRSALRPIPDPRRHEFEFFLHEPTQTACLRELREQRRADSGLRIEFRKALLEEREAKELLDNVLGALRDQLSDASTERALHSYQRRYTAAQTRVDDLRARIDTSENSLRAKGAYVAQAGLLDFIESKRYTLSPLSFANAMAGLPFISWRQSASRCVKIRATHAFGNIFELFLELERALTDSPETAKLALEQVKTHLKKSKRQSEYTTQTLREEWYYLRVAIETAYSRKPPKDAIPYRVFAEYRRRSSSRSQLDQVLAKEEHL